MQIWNLFSSCAKALRSSFSDVRTFDQFVRAFAGMCTRGGDHAGVTSFVRALNLDPGCYRNLLHLFKSSAWSAKTLTESWVSWVMRVFGQYKVNGRYVLIADGIKAPREGRKMPAVKSLHQESASNTKPEYIMGHSFQQIGLLTKHGNVTWSVPLAARIHEGVKFTNRDKRTLHNKLGDLFREVTVAMKTSACKYLLADAYYACASMVDELLQSGDDLVVRVKSNVVAYHAAEQANVKSRGRPKKYGEKVKLKDLFKSRFSLGTISGYDDKEVIVKYCSLDLLWKSVGRIVRFVLVQYPIKGRCIFMTTDLNLEPLAVIEMYTKRFKIETSFKQSVHTIGTFDYHFWLKDMDRIKRGSGTQHLHRESKEYRQAVEEKLESYHRFVALGLVTQGFMQYLSTYFPGEVYAHSAWLRTNTKSGHPSEETVAQALRASLSEFLPSTTEGSALKKILTEWKADNRPSPTDKAA
jgi:hypothetical protein